MADEQPKKPLSGKIIQISYGLIVNIGNYETVRFDLTAQVAPDEDWRDVLDALKLRSRRIKKDIVQEHEA